TETPNARSIAINSSTVRVECPMVKTMVGSSPAGVTGDCSRGRARGPSGCPWATSSSFDGEHSMSARPPRLYRRRAVYGLAVVLGSLLVAIRPVRAQTPDDAGRATVSPVGVFPVVPTNVPRPSLRAVRAPGPITLDGRLEEPAWEVAERMTEFIQSEPNIGYPSTERTDVRILYDEDALYLACLCYDSQP